MIFNLPPILGLVPLAFVIVLAFHKKVHPVMNMIIGSLIGAILMQENLLKFGNVVGEAMGSTMGLIGLTVMFGAGLAEVLRVTGVAEVIVRFIVNRIGINTQRRAILTSMVSGILLVSMLGTMAGANAVIAPVLIPLVAAVGITPATLGLIFLGASQTGLFVGPFSPPAVTVMSLTGQSYPSYLLSVLPLAIVMWVCTYFMAGRVQKITAGKECYGPEDLVDQDKEFVASPKSKRATIVFLVTLFIMVGVGIATQGGAQFALIIVFVSAMVTGISYRMPVTEIFVNILKGAGRVLWIFLLLVMSAVLIKYVSASGAFDVLGGMLTPVLSGAGKPFFSFMASFIGVFGISGAHVAQSVIIDNLFGTLAHGLHLSIPLWTLIMTIGTQITTLAYPNGDMFAAMGMAKAKEIKYMMMLSYCAVIPASLILAAVAGFIL
ncbi:citrate transporter [Butyricicoccus faecihominis]|uniref:Na+/H+ antiporter NhaC family protein n=1 Tax=Butyricicoccus faecihominis TaxID=1712515 RepID=UPI00247B0984|nr:Na+/H+ antiporter NhaC family protein [Butyricicoccus faecihominis]MCQ5129888.1 citrate transporter [Butyricicoccus faecihominis]